MANGDDVIRVVSREGRTAGPDLKAALWFGDRAPALVLGFVSPHLNFDQICRDVRTQVPEPTPLILTTTAGELCTLPGKVSPYLAAGDRWDTMVFQSFSPELLGAVHVSAVPLHNADLRAGTASMTLADRVEAIARNLADLSIPFAVDSSDTFAYTLIDGVSFTENAFMEAVYRSRRLPCLMVGGSSGGLLDFRQTRLFDGRTFRENHALVILAKVAPSYRFGVFRSQNFEKAGPSFVVLGGETAFRKVTHVLDEKTLGTVEFTAALAATLGCKVAEVPSQMANLAFGVEIDGKVYIRSVSSIDVAANVVSFYCDVEVGDRLHLLRKKDFLTTTRDDWKEYCRSKSRPAGGILSDCILRRLHNGAALGSLDVFQEIPVAGFSTFGELLGVNVNETLTALLFHPVDPAIEFHDQFLDHFAVHYASFQASFLERRLTRDNILNALHQQILGRIMAGMPLVKQLMESYSAVKVELDHNSGQLREVLASLAEFTESIVVNTEANSQIYDQVKALSDNLMAINSISETVDDIAQQTGVLSINASIQAARAGSSGRAFAVVAGEVRKLSVETQGHVQAITRTADSIVASVTGILAGAESASHLLGSMVSSNAEVHFKADQVAQQVAHSVKQMEEGNSAIAQISNYLVDISHRREVLNFISKDAEQVVEYQGLPGQPGRQARLP